MAEDFITGFNGQLSRTVYSRDFFSFLLYCSLLPPHPLPLLGRQPEKPLTSPLHSMVKEQKKMAKAGVLVTENFGLYGGGEREEESVVRYQVHNQCHQT